MNIIDHESRKINNYPKVYKKFKEHFSKVNVGKVVFDNEHFVIIAGPCSVESYDQMMEIASLVKNSGAHILRGGAFKPRTSPYSFQGLKEEGLKMLFEAGKAYFLPIVTEVTSIENLHIALKYTDMIQIGARNMYNYELLKEAGKCKVPVLLKRSFQANLDEFLTSAEYILSEGNENVVLCERGIRTFETSSRNTTDLNTVIMVKERTHLPIIVDPSHATGYWYMVEKISKASMVVGADGVMIEVHNFPERALSDGEQSVKPELFSSIVENLKKLSKFENRRID